MMSFISLKSVCLLLTALCATVNSAEVHRIINEPAEPSDTTLQELHVVENTTKSVLDQINAATVSIRSGYGGGSGAIIREDGLILTAAHVAGVPDEDLMVTLANGQIVSARVL